MRYPYFITALDSLDSLESLDLLESLESLYLLEIRKISITHSLTDSLTHNLKSRDASASIKYNRYQIQGNSRAIRC